MTTSYDEMFMKMATVVSEKSKDPRTKVGAVLVSHDQSTVSIGFNGLPRGLEETEDRWGDKYSYVIHAELNAIINSKTNLNGWTLYTTMFPCENCRNNILQTGIIRVVYLEDNSKCLSDTINKTKSIFIEQGVLIERFSDLRGY